jgi:hypothetical protein
VGRIMRVLDGIIMDKKGKIMVRDLRLRRVRHSRVARDIMVGTLV